ncbi:hypothetical protein Tco_1381893, partial [Tanacetum coccineum]
DIIDYLRKISLEMLTLERSQNSVPDLVQGLNHPVRARVFTIGGKGTQQWTEEEDKMLVDALLELHVSGKFVYAHIGSYYVNAVHQLMDPDKRHPDNFYSQNSIRHRMRDDRLWAEYLKGTTKGSKADGLGVKAKDVVKENQIIPCLEDKELHFSENPSSFNGVQKSESSKRKRNEGDEVDDNCVESKVANHGSSAANDTMSKVVSQLKDLPRLTLDERLMAMSVIGRSEPLSVMFDQLDEDGKVRMAQMVADGAIS